MNTTDQGAVASTAELGMAPERVAFEAWKRKQGGHYMSRNNAPGSDLNGYQDAHTQGQWEAWQAAMVAERERCAHACREWQAGRLSHGIGTHDLLLAIEAPNKSYATR